MKVMKVLIVIAALGLIPEASAQCFGGRCNSVVSVAPAVIVQRQVVRRGFGFRNNFSAAGRVRRQVVRQQVIVSPVVQQVVVRRQVVVASPVIFNPVFAAPLVAPVFAQPVYAAPVAVRQTADLNSVNDALRKLQCIRDCLNQ